MHTLGKNDRRDRGDSRGSSRVSSPELVDFLQDQARKKSRKEVARIAQLSIKAVEKIVAGESGASAQTITTWCRNCPEFRAAYFAHCGGVLFGSPEMEGALSRLVNGFVNRSAP